VVIPVHNAAGSLAGQLAGLAAQRVPVPWEVVVADNASTDGTRLVAESWRDRLPLRVVHAPGVLGPHRARNAGTAAARGELLVYCDADDVVQPGWLAAFWEARHGWDLAGGLVESRSLNDARALARHSGERYDGHQSFGWLPGVMGCNLAVHRSTFDAVGGFDESYAGGNEDFDFVFRAQLAGRRLGFVPGAVVSYRFRPSLRAAARQRFNYGRTRVHLYQKFKDSGMPKRSWKHAVRSYARIAARVPDLTKADGRGRWVVRASFMAGLAAGSLHEHTLYLSE